MKYSVLLLCLSAFHWGISQQKLAKLLKKENRSDIPYIRVDSLKSIVNNVHLLDAREYAEFKTSHIKNALPVGYSKFNIDSLAPKIPNKKDTIVVYCSLGIRSGHIAKKLKRAGYSNVLNLYGGIFEWKNNSLEVVNNSNQYTDTIHAFSKAWGKWLRKGIKVYE